MLESVGLIEVLVPVLVHGRLARRVVALQVLLLQQGCSRRPVRDGTGGLCVAYDHWLLLVKHRAKITNVEE